MKIQKKRIFFGGSGQGARGGRVGECQGGWERRSEAFVKIQKKNLGGGRVGRRGGASGRGGQDGC